MIRTAQELTDHVKAAKASLDTVQIDPITKADDARNKQVFIAFAACLLTSPGLFSLNPLSWIVLAGSVWVLYTRISLNEYWELDPSKKEIRATSNKRGQKACSTKFNFQDIAIVAVDGRLHSRKSSSGGSRTYYWKYGMVAFTKSGVLHELYPDLSKNFKDVWDAAEATAELVDADLMPPIPMAELEVVTSSGKAELSYKDSQEDDTLSTQPVVEKAPPMPKNVSEEAEEAAPTPISEPRRRFELLHESQVETSRIIGALGLVLVSPFFLGGVVSLYSGNLISGLILTILLSPIIFLSLRLVIAPIIKEVTYFEPEGIVGDQKFRRWGSPTETQLSVPSSARIVLDESALQKKKIWVLKAMDGSRKIWESKWQKSRAQAEEDGRKMAHTLGLPFEVESEFER